MQNIGCNNLRRGRWSAENQVYHLTFVTESRQAFFLRFDLARILVNALRRETLNGHVDSMAWVVMPDHCHWLVALGPQKPLSVVVNNVKSISARRINRVLHRRGAVWQRGFYDRALRQDEDVPAAARYIVANPIRAGLVRSAGQYPHWDAKWM